MESKKRLELTIWGITSISQIMFFLLFLFVTKGGNVDYAVWKTVNGTLYYSTQTYQAVKLLAMAVVVVISFELLLTIWGICSKSYLAGLASCVGMLMYFGMFTQVFYNAGDNLKKHILFTIIGMVVMTLYYFLIRVKFTKKQGIYIQSAIAVLIGSNLMAIIVNVILEKSTNGSYAWIKLGGISLQPGEFLKVLLILLSAWVYRYRDGKMTKMYIAFCLLSVFTLVVARDLGNAVVLLAICLVGSWFIYDKWIYTLLAFLMGLGGLFVAGRYLPYVRSRFEACFQALESGSGQQFNSLFSIVKSGFIGFGPAGTTVAATHVTSSATDYVFNTFVSIFGIVFALVFLLCLVGIFVQLLVTPVVSPFHYLLGILSGITIFCQYIVHISGNLNIAPLTGICLNWVSSGGSNMISSFMLLAGILACMSPGFEPVSMNCKRKYTMEGDNYDYKNSCKKGRYS